MAAVETTTDMVAGVYEKMAVNQDRARARLGRPLTLSEKLLFGHLEDPDAGELEPGAQLPGAVSGPGGVSGCAGPIRHVAVHGRPGWTGLRCRPPSIAII